MSLPMLFFDSAIQFLGFDRLHNCESLSGLLEQRIRALVSKDAAIDEFT